MLFTVSCRVACYVLENSISINVDEFCIRIVVVELINQSSKLAIENPVGIVDPLHTSSTISAILSQFVWAAPYLTQPNQHKLPCTVVVQILEHPQHFIITITLRSLVGKRKWKIYTNLKLLSVLLNENVSILLGVILPAG